MTGWALVTCPRIQTIVGRDGGGGWADFQGRIPRGESGESNVCNTISNPTFKQYLKPAHSLSPFFFLFRADLERGLERYKLELESWLAR